MKKYFVLIAALSQTFSTVALAKPCEGQPNNGRCQVQFFCKETEPFLIPIEVEIWNTKGLLSLHKFALRNDDTRAEVGAAPVRETTLSHETVYTSARFPGYQLNIDLYTGDANFSEQILGRTIITPMLCLQPAL